MSAPASDRNDVTTALHIFRWDLDKTYLQTEFDSVSDLLKTFLQEAEDKATVPGADVLLRELLRHEGQDRLVTFISGSPQQMREVLQEKLRLDGIDPEAFVLKPSLRNLFRGRFRAIKGQVGYKLEALLKVRLVHPGATETLFGDDAEQDAFIYCLYGDIASGRIGRAKVADILKKARVYPDVIDRILLLIRENAVFDSVGRVFIHLDRNTPTSTFNPFGVRLVPIHNYFQAGLVLFNDEILDAPAVLRLALSMSRHHRYTPSMLANSFQDLIRRRRISVKMASRLSEELSDIPLPEGLPIGLEPTAMIEEFRRRLRAASGGGTLLDDPGVPNYLELVDGHGKKGKKKRTK